MSGFPPTHAPPPEDTRVAPAFDSTLFALNRVCDALFLSDIILQFNLMFPNPVSQRVEQSRRAIAAHYVRGPFLLDFVSTIPFDLIATLAQGTGSAAGQMTLRALRALRLIKLLRLARLSRVFERLEEAANIASGYVTLTKFFAATLLLAHWLACGLHMVVQFEGVRGGRLDWFWGLGPRNAVRGAAPPAHPCARRRERIAKRVSACSAAQLLTTTPPRLPMHTRPRRRTATGWRRCSATAPSRAPSLPRSCRPWGACMSRR
jgi:hypothetical protein